MLKSITWSDYFIAALVLGGAWYLIITLIYFRKELFNILSGKFKIPLKKSATGSDAETDTPEKEHTFEELEGIVTDIRHSILEVAGKGANKETLLNSISERLANYGGLRLPAFRIAINNFIIHNSENICGVAFSEEELDEAWEALPR